MQIFLTATSVVYCVLSGIVLIMSIVLFIEVLKGRSK